MRATLTGEVPYKMKVLVQTLAENFKQRPATQGGARVVVSGAGPVGLRVHRPRRLDRSARRQCLPRWSRRGRCQSGLTGAARVVEPCARRRRSRPR